MYTYNITRRGTSLRRTEIGSEMIPQAITPRLLDELKERAKRTKRAEYEIHENVYFVVEYHPEAVQ